MSFSQKCLMSVKQLFSERQVSFSPAIGLTLPGAGSSGNNLRRRQFAFVCLQSTIEGMDQRRYRRYPSPTIQPTATCLKDLVGCRRVYCPDSLYNFPLSQATEDTMCSYALTGPQMAVFLAWQRSSCVSSVFVHYSGRRFVERTYTAPKTEQVSERIREQLIFFQSSSPARKFPSNCGKLFGLSPDCWELHLQLICFSTRWDLCCPVFGTSSCIWNVRGQQATDIVIVSQTDVKVSYPAPELYKSVLISIN